MRQSFDGLAARAQARWAHDARTAQRRGALLEREYHTLVQLAHELIDHGDVDVVRADDPVTS